MSQDFTSLSDLYPIDPLMDAWRSASGDFELLGADGALRSCLLADISRRLERFVVLVTPDQDSARRVASDLRIFIQEEADDDDERPVPDAVLYYPEYDVGPFHQASPDRKNTLARLTALHRLLDENDQASFLVTSARAFVRRVLPPQIMRQHTHELAIEDEIDNRTLRRILGECGFTEVPVVEDPGTFAVRGDIVDIFSPAHPHPVRVERWGDEIAELRTFHPETQRSTGELDACILFPVRQEILTDDSVVLAQERLHALGEQLATPTSSIHTMITDLRAGIHFIGIDAMLPAFHESLADLGDYLPEDAIVALVDPDEILESVASLHVKRAEEHAQVVADGDPFFLPEAYYRTAESLRSWFLERKDRVTMRRVRVVDAESSLAMPPTPEERSFIFRARENADVVGLRKQAHGVEQAVRDLATKITEEWSQTYGRICFACRSQGQVDRLVTLLGTFGVDALALPTPIDVSEPIPPPTQVVEVYHAPLAQGFRSEMLGVAVVAGSEIFGSRVATREDHKQFSEHAAISHFRDLTPGDLVVHIDFGVGRYRGLVHMEVGGIANEFLQLEYAGDDKLYLPIYRLGRVQRYIGAPEIRLDKLGGTGWEKTKEKVKANIREVAGELLALYAKREMAKGLAFSPPDDLYREFEAKFPFEETPDQARAIAETINDMCRIRPMDRLICGDVGFGKTEVAIRAAMKAVVDGKQVAVLVPTTILAEQHMISFRKRLSEFGVSVECLNRFRTTKQTKEIIKRAAEGHVDVLIGTHRLLGKEVVYRDLGLLIVDEEQRFGVTHKEKIKKLRHTIDILTLSATPIPRTLQMSLLGIRDLSIIATPPHNRLAVRTHVAKFSDRIVREAIMRELSRGGQVFFVHNRVATIEEMAEHLEGLLPEARIGIGHGQMGEGELEKIMLAYVRGEINVLLCSSIVESGLDIPNANTIIVNRADRFGLSQLYQLRGRVGRGSDRAYAYLLIPNRAKLGKDAEKRLDVIQTHTELGSGFHVASYDLEIRGAGNLLGDNQSGHVTAVGLDLYNDLLEEAVNDIRGEDLEDDFEPEVNIAITTYIPEDYIQATSLRLVFYKRFSLARTIEELDLVFAEMVDRFGGAPEAVRNLKGIVAIKIGLRDIRARRLDAGPSAISIELDATTRLRPDEVLRLVRESRGKFRLTDSMKLIYKLKPDESMRPLETSRKLLDLLLSTI